MANEAQMKSLLNENKLPKANFVMTGDTKRTDAVGNIYIHKNDPKVVNKGIFLTDVLHAQGGYLPILASNTYNQRKQENGEYLYNARVDHGTRPMHCTTFDLGHQSNERNFITKHKIDYQGFKLRPEYLPTLGKNQFEHHFEIGTNKDLNLNTHYGSEFYVKNNDKDYTSNFDLMPKYSVGKQLNQLEKENKIREYNNRKSTINEALVIDKHEPNYWTQYKRTHDYLGHLRGNGVSKIYPEKESYNILTGEIINQVKNNNRKTSGDLIMSSARQNYEERILF
ncbi:hypothetical protein BpHYR1_041446 [Brachionus plicatilis]|uniref:Uncharacterized protein n=1 Tax=Brachionus plicatilis TaxID=10195 RepID=A0A3M7SWM1_BRAPC|nr:hypothetical protein BpHYR1_041446 [Brachionus plicatilis]